ncbi:MAG TPA: hypothetical protein VFE46_07910 [Pirellulales bacterium]|jgi:hypothetical protein|nr:hypothetical protein [Pirellulales bacterium]
MAREEESREDLLREATALVVRVELAAEGFDEPIVAGFRRDGAASFFFGQQTVYQFNAAAELRRGFLDGQLYKAECGRLVQLTRHRTPETVELLRHELNEAETAQFLAAAHDRLLKLELSLSTHRFRVVGQVPPQEDITGRVRDWLTKLPPRIPLASSPRLS